MDVNAQKVATLGDLIETLDGLIRTSIEHTAHAIAERTVPPAKAISPLFSARTLCDLLKRDLAVAHTISDPVGHTSQTFLGRLDATGEVRGGGGEVSMGAIAVEANVRRLEQLAETDTENDADQKNS